MSRHQLWTAPCPGVPIERVLSWVAEADATETTLLVPNKLVAAQAKAQWSSRRMNASPQFLTWPEFWKGAHARFPHGPGWMTDGQRRQILLEAIRRAQGDGSLSCSPSVARSAGFEEFVSERIATWTRMGLGSNSTCPAPADATPFAVFAHYRRIATGLRLEDDAGMVAWLARQLYGNGLPLQSVVVLHADVLDDYSLSLLRTFRTISGRMLVTLACPAEPDRPEFYADCIARRAEISGFGFQVRTIDPTPPRRESPAVVGEALTHDKKRSLKAGSGVRHLGVPQGEGEAMAVADVVSRWLRDGVDPKNICIAVPDDIALCECICWRLRDEGVPVNDGIRVPLNRDPAVAALMRGVSTAERGCDRRLLTGLLRHNAVALKGGLSGLAIDPFWAAAGMERVPVSRGLRELQRGLARELDRHSREDRRAARPIRELKAAHDVLERLAPALRGLTANAPFTAHVGSLRLLSAELGLDMPPSPAYLCLFEALDRAAEVIARLGCETREWTSAEFAREVTRLSAACPLEADDDVPGVQMVRFEELIGTTHTHRVVVGLQEGAIPNRARLESGGLWGMAAQRRAFINLFASCRQSIVLISPTTDENGQTLPASSFLDDVASCFSDRAWANCERLHNRITPQVASSFNAIRRNMRLGLLLSATTAHGYQQLSSAVRSDDAVDALRGVAIALHTTRKRRRKCHDGPFDGMLSASVAEAIFRRIGRHFSVRELESYAHCPFQYFLASILRLASSVRDELSDDSRSVGTAAHTSLAKLHTVLPAYAEGDLSDALGQAIEKALADEISEQSEPVSAVERGYRHYVHLRTERLLRHYALQYENYRTDFDEVVHEEFEYRFGPGGGVEVEIHSADTGTIQIAGKIDRIDRVRCDGAEGLRVVDYRAGASATKVDVKRGLSLEAPIGLLAAELIARDRGVGGVMDAGCWSLRESGFAALVQGDVAGDDSWARQRDAILRYLSALLSNVKGGRFPVAPRQSGCERRCDFATVCRIGELRPLAKSWTDAPQLGAAERPAGEP